MIAVEKAVRHAADGERVLFLCYNSELKKFLVLHYENPLIDFMTLDGYVCRLCGVSVSDYGRAEKKLKDFAAFDSFPYDHVIVDEGQDFGRDAVENAKLLHLLHDAVLADPNSKSSCYVFYDRFRWYSRIGSRALYGTRNADLHCIKTAGTRKTYVERQ